MLICPADVVSFSTGAFKNSYYVCDGEGEEAILTNCPPNHYYKSSTEKCHKRFLDSNGKKAKEDKDDTVEYTSHVLGRPVMLGSLFDARRNQIFATTSLWSRQRIEKMKYVSKSYSSDVSFYAAQSTYERMAHLDVHASLVLDYLGECLPNFPSIVG